MFRHFMLIVGVLVMGVHLFGIVLTLPQQPVSLAETVAEAMPHSGVKNPVTAVLLNFRGYDTLLEVAVLLLAVLGVWSLPSTPERPQFSLPKMSGPLPVALVRLVVPLAILFGSYLLWVGADAPGGAFQAGAIIAGAWLLLVLVGYPETVLLSERWLRPLLVVGFAVFLSVAVGLMGSGRALLEYPHAWTKEWLLLIEFALTISITCILVSLFTGRPLQEAHREQAPPPPPVTKETK